MRAVGLMRHGGPEVLEIVDVPEVHAGHGQVRVRVRAAQDAADQHAGRRHIGAEAGATGYLVDAVRADRSRADA